MTSGAGLTLQTTEDDAPARRAAPEREPAPAHLFRLLECDQPLQLPARTCLRGIAAVTFRRRSERGAAEEELAGQRRLSLFVPDPLISTTHAQLRRSAEGWLLEDAGSRNGTRVNGEKVASRLLADGDLLELGHTFFLFRESLPAPPDAPAHLEASAAAPALPGLKTLLPAFHEELLRLATVAPSRLTIMVRGETGTGKEVVAQAVHAASQRPGAFQAVNCGALPLDLLEAELFGSKKGAFSGALEDRPGLVRASDRGTLFLDEIGELPLVAQAALLRVLEESEVTPVGGTRPVKVDLRLVVATHRDLESMAAAGSFRPDLLARLAGFTLALPRLRERREDLGLLISALLRRHAPEAGAVSLRPQAARQLLQSDWPLNVRQLDRTLAAAVLLAAGGPIDVGHLPPAPPAARPAPGGPAPAALTDEDLRRREELVAALEKHRGNLTAVAREIGKARTQVQRWIHRFAIDLSPYRR